MDERELETLFRDAPGEVPPPTFTARDVANASRRATARRRSVIVASCGAAIVLLGGVGVVTAALNSETQRSASPAFAPAPSGSEGAVLNSEQPGSAEGRLPSAQVFPGASPKQGGEPTGKDGPRAGSTSGCDKVDRELATALAGELPVTAGDDRVPGRICPAGMRAAGVPIGAGGEMVTAVLVPRGNALQLAEQPEGTMVAEAPRRGGGKVLVVSTPGPGTTDAPLAGELQRIAKALGERF